jgi:putative hemolysin
MEHSWQFYLFCSLICVMAQGFFSMFEMACVSFNKVRLQYYVGLNMKRALWIQALWAKPSRLFGTTLIGVNLFLQVGSEFSRRFYESIHLDPDFAPITQILLVVIFGELAPMFAARRHSEQVAMLYIPVIFTISKILFPLIWFIEGLNHVLQRLFGKKKDTDLFLSREEIQRAFEERDTQISTSEKDVFTTFSTRFFSLRNKTAGHAMIPLHLCPMIPSSSTLEEMKHALSVHYSPFLPLYHRQKENVVAIAYPRDFLKYVVGKKVIDYARPPWFIVQTDPLLSILKQFKRNNQSVAVVLDESGQAVGVLTLDDLVDEIFGEPSDQLFQEDEEQVSSLYIERTLSGDMLVSQFNVQFHAALAHEPDETISELLNRLFKHHPVKGESIRIEQFEFIVSEPALFGAKSVSVRTRTK